MQSGQKAQPTCIFIGDSHSGPSIFQKIKLNKNGFKTKEIWKL